MKYRTYTQLEAILHTVFNVKGNSIKTAAQLANITLHSFKLFALIDYRFPSADHWLFMGVFSSS